MTAHAPAAATAPQSDQQSVSRLLTLEQEELVRDFKEVLGIERHQLSFGIDSADPVLDLDALFAVAINFAPEFSFNVEPGEIRADIGIATATCTISRDQRCNSIFGSALVNEEMPGLGKIENLKQALDVAQSRAFRRGLRFIGCDPVKTVRQAKALTLELKLEPKSDQERYLDGNAEIHALAFEAGYIKPNGDKRPYYALMYNLFPGVVSSAHMTEAQRSQWITTLRAFARTKGSLVPDSAPVLGQGTTGRTAESALRSNAEARA